MRVGFGGMPKYLVTAVLLIAAVLIAGKARAAGLPDVPISFTADQEISGRALYASQCAKCHGADLSGLAGPSLQGGHFTVAWLNGGRTVGDLYRRIQSMPPNSPHSLTDQQYLDVAVFLLSHNGYSNGTERFSLAMATTHLRPPVGSSAVAGPLVRPVLPQSAATAGTATTSAPGDAEILKPNDASWIAYNRTLEGRRYSPLEQINTGNADQLAPRCIFQLGEIGSFQASPVIYDQVMYVTTAFGTYALDATSCREVWAHHYPPENKAPVLNSHGVAIYRGKVFRATPNGHLLALDAKTGKLLWDAWLSDADRGYWISAAPVAFDGKVFIGEAGAEWGVNAHIFAFNAESGKHVWTFDVIPTGKQPGAESWKHGAEHGGGSLWSTITIDPDRHLLLAPTGNPAPDFDGALRPGDNLFTNSVVALDDETGALRWYVQQVPHDTHDSDTAAAPVLFEQDGRSYMAVANKAGWLYIYDAETKQLLSKTEVAPHENFDLPVTAEGVHTCPGINGGVEWNGPAYSPSSHLLFVNSVHWCTTTRLSESRFIEGASYFGGEYTFDPVADARGFTNAIDATTGKLVWARTSSTPMLAGLTPTAGGVVFTGDLDGYFLTLDAATGKVLYRFDTGGSVAGGISTYAIGGKQYVAVASGNNSRTLWATTGAPTIVVFALTSK
jgi:alcohol dehydrogenase (cytochrome c)